MAVPMLTQGMIQSDAPTHRYGWSVLRLVHQCLPAVASGRMLWDCRTFRSGCGCRSDISWPRFVAPKRRRHWPTEASGGKRPGDKVLDNAFD